MRATPTSSRPDADRADRADRGNAPGLAWLLADARAAALPLSQVTSTALRLPARGGAGSTVVITPAGHVLDGAPSLPRIPCADVARLVTGSFVSGLMRWPEVDVMVLVGPDFSPPDVLALLARIVARPEVTGLDYRDERGPRCVTGEVRDERSAGWISTPP